MKINIQDVLIAMLRSWWIIVLATIITTATTLFFGLRQDSIYQATTTVELQPNSVLSDNLMINLLNVLTGRRTVMNTYAQKATSSTIYEESARKLGIPVNVISRSDLTAVVLPETTLIEIRAEANDPKLAAAITNTVAEELVKQSPSMVIMIEVINYADGTGSAISPQPSRLMTMGVATGVGLGVMFALLLYILQTYLRSLGVFDAPEATPEPEPSLVGSTPQ
jgi:capsular polysaccharide biosynthesis protein